MSTEALIQVGISAGAYALFLWLLTWPLRHASWLQSARFEMHRRQALRWQDQRAGR